MKKKGLEFNLNHVYTHNISPWCVGTFRPLEEVLVIDAQTCLVLLVLYTYSFPDPHKLKAAFLYLYDTVPYQQHSVVKRVLRA